MYYITPMSELIHPISTFGLGAMRKRQLSLHDTRAYHLVLDSRPCLSLSPLVLMIAFFLDLTLGFCCIHKPEPRIHTVVPHSRTFAWCRVSLVLISVDPCLHYYKHISPGPTLARVRYVLCKYVARNVCEPVLGRKDDENAVKPYLKHGKILLTHNSTPRQGKEIRQYNEISCLVLCVTTPKATTPNSWTSRRSFFPTILMRMRLHTWRVMYVEWKRWEG